MTDYTGLADNTFERDPVADAITASGTERSRAVAALITQTVNHEWHRLRSRRRGRGVQDHR
jgi:hypothetical protein